MPSVPDYVLNRARSSLWLLFTGDALSMPVHWFYNTSDIPKYFPPSGITKMEAAPEDHPGAMMSLDSENGGPQIVGGVILKGKRQFWGIPNTHYHRGLPAGENTLNAYCARLMMRHLAAQSGHYDKKKFFDSYISWMTADTPQHPDTYAESYHRGFFANLIAGKPPLQCGALTDGTASVGGLVTVAPLAICELLRDRSLARVKQLAREHVFVTHPDEGLGAFVEAYVGLIDSLLFRKPDEDASIYLEEYARIYVAGKVPKWKEARDTSVIGGSFSPACSITDSWPSLIYVAAKYSKDAKAGLLANTNVGGENCHRGSVLGSIFGLATSSTPFADQLLHKAEIQQEIEALLNAVSSKA